MEELEQLFNDNLDAVITLYKCCEASRAGVYVEQLKPEELTEEQKLHIAKFTKTMKSNGKILNVCDWVSLAGNSVDSGPIWASLQEGIDKLPVTNARKVVRRKSIKSQYFEPLEDTVPEGCEGLTVDEIYEKTGKIVPKIVINSKKKKPSLNSDKLDDLKESAKKAIDEVIAVDAQGAIRDLMGYLRRKDKSRSYNSKQFHAPDYIKDIKGKFDDETNKLPISGDHLTYKILAKMNLSGYKPAIIEPNKDCNGDYNSWELVDGMDSVLSFEDVYSDSGESDMELYDTESKIGLYKRNRKIQHLQYNNKLGIHTTLDRDFLIRCIKAILEKEHKGQPVHKYIKENYLQQPKSFYVRKNNSGIYGWHYINIALDIYHYENLLIPTFALRRFTEIFGGKTPDEWINYFKEI